MALLGEMILLPGGENLLQKDPSQTDEHGLFRRFPTAHRPHGCNINQPYEEPTSSHTSPWPVLEPLLTTVPSASHHAMFYVAIYAVIGYLSVLANVSSTTTLFIGGLRAS